MNTGASWPLAAAAAVRVREIQTKLHRWAKHNPDRQFDDLFNLQRHKVEVAVNWGIAAVVWYAVGRLLARLLLRR